MGVILIVLALVSVTFLALYLFFKVIKIIKDKLVKRRKVLKFNKRKHALNSLLNIKEYTNNEWIKTWEVKLCSSDNIWDYANNIFSFSGSLRNARLNGKITIHDFRTLRSNAKDIINEISEDISIPIKRFENTRSKLLKLAFSYKDSFMLKEVMLNLNKTNKILKLKGEAIYAERDLTDVLHVNLANDEMFKRLLRHFKHTNYLKDINAYEYFGPIMVFQKYIDNEFLSIIFLEDSKSYPYFLIKKGDREFTLKSSLDIAKICSKKNLLDDEAKEFLDSIFILLRSDYLSIRNKKIQEEAEELF